MAEIFQGWAFTIFSLAVITLVFAIAYVSLWRELGYVRSLADYLGYDLTPGGADSETRPEATLTIDAIRDEAAAILAARDPAWAQKQVRTWQMRVQRLEPALAFWVDFLRQLGLLGTVLGLGMSLLVGGADIEALVKPLALAVWTTVFGLAFSVWLTAQFGMKLPVWADTCEKNIEAWDARRRAAAAVDGKRALGA
ncbi:MAG TPA: MotA/TolQ/ExbB proton channel family protein [Kofleriaceae bacterium]|nr:MotA/TolQ/ExbB proton channel family protein [Kofleriaceae bacterium]